MGSKINRLQIASEGLVDGLPEYSAKGAIAKPINLLLKVLVIFLLFFTFFPDVSFYILVAVFNFFFLSNLLLKIAIFLTSYFSKRKPDETYKSLKGELPIYTILVPLYKEKEETIEGLVEALSALEYPKEKLDIKLITEEHDRYTNSNITNNLPEFFSVVIVPNSVPKTKPKALNYAMFEAKGEYICIYDAEDRPDKMQLKKALVGLQNHNIVQGQLTYHNWDKNWLTRMFYIEYECLFKFFLPALEYFDLPIPLGGTSNHFKREELIKLGGWDAYNVTEDADLGIRYYREGRKVDIIDSETKEEAPSNLRNWLNQRSRWIKGYIQTLIVHLRRPVRTYRELGFVNFFAFLFFIGAPTITFLIMPIAVTLSILILMGYTYNLPEYFVVMTIINLLLGLLFHIFIGVVIAIKSKKTKLELYSLTYPFYWLLHPVAGLIALYEIFFNPYHWRKTEHSEGVAA